MWSSCLGVLEIVVNRQVAGCVTISFSRNILLRVLIVANIV
jgi:hypothetical protein